MKSFLRAAAATGVAAATLAAGISFGSAANADIHTDDARASSSHYLGRPFKLVAKSGSGYTAMTSAERAPVKTYSSLKTAELNAGLITPVFVDRVDGVDRWMLFMGDPVYDAKGQGTCLSNSSYNTIAWTTTWIPRDVCNFDAPSRTITSWRWDAAAHAFASWDYPDRSMSPVIGSNGAGPDYYTVQRAVPADAWALPIPQPGLHADVADADVEAGTAHLKNGVAPDDADAVELTYRDKDGKTVRPNVDVADGKWEASLRNLALGKTTVHLTAFDGAEAIAENDVEVDLPVTPLTAEATFGDELDDVATISGTATGETEVKLFHGEEQIASTTSLKDGSYSIPVNAPNMAGKYDLTVTQTIRGEDATPKELSIDYGIGVSITSPAQGVELQPGDQLTITGAAQKSSKIRVYEKGKPEAILAETTAGKTTDTYRAVLRDLEDREYQLVVDSLSKGYNHTTAELSVNPGKSVELDPATVTTESFTPGKTNTFEGTATKDATLRVVNRWGTDLLGKDVTVKTDGTWSFDRAVSASSTKFEFRLVQTKGNLSTTSEVFTIAADTANSLVDPTVTAPTAVVLGENNTFTGTATADASLKIVNASGTDLLGHPVTVTGSGDWTFDRVVSRSAKNFTFYIEQTKNGTTKKTGPYVINPADPAASLVDPTVTAPTAVALGVNNTFTGTATEDASLKIVNASGTDLLGHPVTVTGSGDWTFDRVVSWNAKNFTFYIEQTKNGATKKTGPYVINPATN
ncbi:hypothetical protein [uncultured Curtobacterium sp.]|uniref:hypothetical protein n=2 Tax=Curtobacterium TaxID=2034 RepID=UPI0025840EA2|nr:hypothetical protein [uncultured Curtobacterium sp.]